MSDNIELALAVARLQERVGQLEKMVEGLLTRREFNDYSSRTQMAGPIFPIVGEVE